MVGSLGVVVHWVWWLTPVIPELRKLRQEDGEFKVSMHCIVSSKPAWITLRYSGNHQPHGHGNGEASSLSIMMTVKASSL
jgi:hypothetical protein